MITTIIVPVTLLMSAVGIPPRALGSVPFRVAAIVLVAMLLGLAVPAVPDRSVQASSCSTVFLGSLATTTQDPWDPGAPIGRRCFDFSPYVPEGVTVEGCHECTVWWDPSWNIFRGRVSLVIHCVDVDTGAKSRIHVEDHCWLGRFC